MIQRVYERANEAAGLDNVVIATDSEEIAQAARAFGAEAVLTSADCQTGLDRILEVIQRDSFKEYTHIVNVQGDEPLIHRETIEGVIGLFTPDDRSRHVATAATPFLSAEEFLDPNRVKVVAGENNRALYFSRSPIPHDRNRPGESFRLGLKHLGIYGYSREILLRVKELQPTTLEKTEMLEQLRLLENGIDIYLHRTPHDSPGIDTPEDLQLLLSRPEFAS